MVASLATDKSNPTDVLATLSRADDLVRLEHDISFDTEMFSLTTLNTVAVVAFADMLDVPISSISPSTDTLDALSCERFSGSGTVPPPPPPVDAIVT